MDSGTLELQIFVSLLAFLGIAFVALLCDYLKGNNEQLREHNLELRVRKEEREKHEPQEAVEWLQHLLGANQRNPVRLGSMRVAARQQHAATPAPATQPAATAPLRPVQPPVPVSQPVPAPTPQVTPVEAPAAALVESNATEPPPRFSRLAEARARRQGMEAADAAPGLLESLPVPAWLKKEQEEKVAARAHHAIQREELPPQVPTPATAGTDLGTAVTSQKPEDAWAYRGLLDRVVAATNTPRSPVEQSEPVSQQISLVQTAAGQPAEKISTVTVEVPAKPEEVPTARTLDPKPHNEEGVTSILDAWTARPRHERKQAGQIVPEPRPAVTVAASPAFAELQLPPGFQDRSVLSKCLQSTDMVTGVVVAIGINDYAQLGEKMGASAAQDLLRSVEIMIHGLLRPDVDFGCRSSEDEFVLVFPRETGPEAQRRLTTISERLWNFQLRSLSSLSVLFSWGAVEVQGETLADAVASASERMYQTKRSRKTVSMDGQRRKLAVNL